ncbi:unnamed protein product [Discosporangium mesarthrocarpum]
MSLILYGAPLSPFVRKADVTLREKGLEFELEPVNIMPMPDWFKEISPAKRIPVLRDTDYGKEGAVGTIPDSSAICAFLDRKYPDVPLYPSDPYEYGRALFYEEYADTVLMAPIGLGIFRPIMFNVFQKKDPDLDRARKTLAEEMPPIFDYLEGELDGKTFLVGERLSIADVTVACCLTQLTLVAGNPDVSRWPALVGHYERMMARESFQPSLAMCRKVVPQTFLQAEGGD